MDDQQVIGCSSNPTDDIQRVEGQMDHLLEECWFFSNLLLGKTRYSRSNSDPSSSSTSSSNQEEYTPSVSEVYAEIIKQEKSTEQEIGEGATDMIKVSTLKNKSLMRASQGLNRAPSLPAKMELEMKESCEEFIPKIGKSSRQSSLTPTLLPPRKGHAKGRMSRTESLNLEAINEMRNGYIKYKKNTKKTASALESEEVQGFKDLGFNFDASNLSPDVVSILPGLQDKKKAMSSVDELAEVKNEDVEEDGNGVHNYQDSASRRSPYLSEAWQLQRSSSSISNWVVNKSSEDMKAQLKSWARTVASNVR